MKAVIPMNIIHIIIHIQYLLFLSYQILQNCLEQQIKKEIFQIKQIHFLSSLLFEAI